MSRRAPRSRNVPWTTRALTSVFVALALVIALVPLGTTVASASAPAAPAPTLSAEGVDLGIAKMTLAGFKAGNIMSDEVFTDATTMTEAQIQAFFDSKVKTCRGGEDKYGPIVCLKDFHITSVDRPADRYCDGYKGAANESAARIIYRVSISCDINPRVLIVMLQKEQSLVTHTWPSAWRYDKALGQGCPDGGVPCNPDYVGFFHQIYGAGRQMQQYMEGRYFSWYAPGNTWQILYHPNRACGTSPVYIANKATSALYYYTPYQPNPAALKAGYGSGDGCSSYGNRNFYNYFTDWFGSTQVADVDVCAVPGTVGKAYRQYVTTTGLNARMAPSTKCDTDVFTLDKGTILQSRRVTADGSWIELLTLEGPRWVAKEYLRYANTAESECVDPSGTSAVKGRYVAKTSTPAKLAPWAACDLKAGTLLSGSVVEAERVSHSGKWLQVRTHDGLRWVARSAVAEAGASDVAAACAAPAGTSTTADRYVMRTNASAWPSPLTRCVVDERPIGTGTVVQATRVSYSGKYIQLRTGVGLRWVPTDAVAVCADPAGTKSSDDRFVVRENVAGLVSPLAECGTAAAHWGTGTAPLKLAPGAVIEGSRVSYSGKWLEVHTQSGLRWIPSDSVDKATSSDVVAACEAPAGTSADSGTYVLRRDTRGLVSPLSSCATGEQLRAGSALQATRLSYSGNWLQVRTLEGLRWVARDAVEEADQADIDAACTSPAGTSRASGDYLVRSTTDAWVSPISRCGVGGKLSGGSVVEATRLSYSGNWLQVRTHDGLRWIARSAVTTATAANAAAACADPAGTSTTTDQYVMRTDASAWPSPLTKCAVDEREIGVGTVVQALAVSSSGEFIQLQTGVGPRWVSSDAVEVCADPAGTTPVDGNYTVRLEAEALVSPLSDCGPAAAHWGTGTAPLRIDPGTVLEATRLSKSGDWLEVRTTSGLRWVPSDVARSCQNQWC